MTTAERESELMDQTPGQWAVRWFAVVAFAVLCGSVPFVHLLWHGLLGNETPIIRTRSQKSPEEYTTELLASGYLDGTWMEVQEKRLQEASPITWWLRGHCNELRYRAGFPQSRAVHFGKDEWFFIQRSIEPNNAGYERATAKRLAFMAEVRDIVKAAGAELFMMIMPDKARIYPDYAYADGKLPPNKADNYARILADIESLGIATVDLAAPMIAHRRSPVPGIPPGELYFSRDTHWQPPGALLTGYTAAAAIEARFGAKLLPRVQMQITGPETFRALGDLTGLLGILTTIEPDPVTGQRTAALSLLSDRLAEVRHYYSVNILTEQGPVGSAGDDPDAEILLIGTSFAEENGRNALTLALGRSVRSIIIRGPEGMLPLRATMAELRAGTKAKIVVWEMVERGLFEGAWLDPKL